MIALELFAGVGGFRIGLERSGVEVVWSNQWEPSDRQQIASKCYVNRFGEEGHVNEDIKVVLDKAERGGINIPYADLFVGGFPCQDYSVARSNAQGLSGARGALWWEIQRITAMQKPRFLLLENVDRLLSSPSSNRGSDFLTILSCLAELDYTVSWRVINAADYGFPQRRRRLFIFAERGVTGIKDLYTEILDDGVFMESFPANPSGNTVLSMLINSDKMMFRNSGIMHDGEIATIDCKSSYNGGRMNICDVLQQESDVDPSYYIQESDIHKWRYLKGSKWNRRVKNGYEYTYTEGAMSFPDSIHKPSRTILTSEGGVSPSRTKHIIMPTERGLRRFTPIEIERLTGFPDDWTIGYTPRQRAFLMGNAVITGVVEKLSRTILGKHSHIHCTNSQTGIIVESET